MQNLHIVKNVNESYNMIFWIFNCFANSPTNHHFLTLAWSLAAKKLGRKLKLSLELLILTLCFHLPNITCNVYFADLYSLRLVNYSPGWRIILQEVLAVFKQKYRLWLYINSQLILRIGMKSQEEFCVSHATANHLTVKCLLSEVFRGPVKKNRSLVLFDTNCSFTQYKYPFIDERIILLFIKLSKKNVIFLFFLLGTNCLVFEDGIVEASIPSFIW